MIPLTIKAFDPDQDALPYLVRLQTSKQNMLSTYDALLKDMPRSGSTATSNTMTVYFPDHTISELEGDVLYINPSKNIANRIVRARSKHNTFLVTEQCDQLCIMCSQPPKKYHHDLFEQFTQAAMLAPQNTTIGISGGEPMLHKKALFSFLDAVLTERPDLQFHILTNAQHFTESDKQFLTASYSKNILWGVPVYSHSAITHDHIVGKENAHKKLLRNLAILVNSGARLEIRTVIMQENADDLFKLAQFVTRRLASAEIWAIMQLENIGYARKNWKNIFFDHSENFSTVEKALKLSLLKDINVCLYNFPLCTIPQEFRALAPSTISDWKQKYLPICSTCDARNSCGGFFEWYDPENGFQELSPL